MQHIEILYQNIAALDKENKELRRNYEVLQTKFRDCQNKKDNEQSLRPWSKLQEVDINVTPQGEDMLQQEILELNFHRAEETDAQRQGEDFQKTRQSLDVKYEKEEDLNVCDMAVKCKVEKEEATGRSEKDSHKEILEPQVYCAAIKRSEKQSRGMNFLKTFCKVKEKRSPHQNKANLEDMSISNEMLSHARVESQEHKNEPLRKEKLFPRKLSVNPTALKAEQESLKQDTESLKEDENINGLSDRSREQKDEKAMCQALLNELRQLQKRIDECKGVNKVLRFEVQRKEDELGQLLKESKDELDSLVLCNDNLTKQFRAEKKMGDILNATIVDLKERCKSDREARLKITNEKHQESKRRASEKGVN